MITADQLRVRLAAYLKRKNIKASAFGRKVMGDPAWVYRFLDGAEPKEATRQAVLAEMRANP